MMRLLFDNIIYSLQKSGGISVYWFELSKRFIGKIDCEYIEYSDAELNKYRSKLAISSSVIYYLKKHTLSRYLSVDLAIKNKEFIFHSSYYRVLSRKVKKNNRVKVIVTVHDFTYELYSKGIRRILHTWQKRMAIQSADIVICISENTKMDLLRIFPQYSNKEIRVVYNGIGTEYKLIPGLNTNVNSCPFFLYVGTRKGYKNFRFIVRVLEDFPGYTLKIVGETLSFKERKFLNDYIPSRWDEFGFLSNEVLNEYYNKAFALLYPSSYEGFGIPIVEAMKAGCPFIALKCSSITEIAGEAGFLMEELTKAEFMKGVNFISNHRDSTIKLGLERAKLFSWDLCAQQTLDIYNSIINNK